MVENGEKAHKKHSSNRLHSFQVKCNYISFPPTTFSSCPSSLSADKWKNCVHEVIKFAFSTFCSPSFVRDCRQTLQREKAEKKGEQEENIHQNN